MGDKFQELSKPERAPRTRGEARPGADRRLQRARSIVPVREPPACRFPRWARAVEERPGCEEARGFAERSGRRVCTAAVSWASGSGPATTLLTVTLRLLLPSVAIPDEGINFQSVVSQLERELITRCLEKTGGNKRQAARLLNLSRTTLIDKLHRLNIAAAAESAEPVAN